MGGRSVRFVRFALGRAAAGTVTLGGTYSWKHVSLEKRTRGAQFDLTLTVGEGPDGMLGPGSTAATIREATIARWAECFSILLKKYFAKKKNKQIYG